MITILGNGWAELSFPIQISVNNKPSVWRTYARVVSVDKDKVLVEYYDMEQNEVRKLFDYVCIE